MEVFLKELIHTELERDEFTTIIDAIKSKN